MIEKIILLRIGVIIGKIFGPTFDEVGIWLKSILLKKVKFDASTAYKKIESLLSDNLIKNGWEKFTDKKTFLSDGTINEELKNYGPFQRKKIKKIWIEKAIINNYNGSHIFFAGMELLFSQLKENDIIVIYEKFKDNDQAFVEMWIEEIKQRKPKIISRKIGDIAKFPQEKK